MSELFEKLAAIEHERWADWQKYMHAQCVGHDAESVLLPRISYDHWERQIATAYDDLSEAEKESDRDQVRRYWPMIEILITDVRTHKAVYNVIISRSHICSGRDCIGYLVAWDSPTQRRCPSCQAIYDAIDPDHVDQCPKCGRNEWGMPHLGGVKCQGCGHRVSAAGRQNSGED